MDATAPGGAIKMMLPCADTAEFQDKWASRFTGEFFIPYATRVPPGTHLAVRLTLRDGSVAQRGTVEVARSHLIRGKAGVVARFISDAEPELLDEEFEDEAQDAAREFEQLDTRATQRSAEIARLLKPPEPAPPPKPGFAPILRDGKRVLPLRSPADSDDDRPVVSGRATAESAIPANIAASLLDDDESPALAPTAVPPHATEQPAARAPAPTSQAPRRWKLGAVVAVAAAGIVAAVAITVSSPPKERTTNTALATPQGAQHEPSTDGVPSAADQQVAKLLAEADRRIAAGDLAGPGSALEQLTRARELNPTTSEVTVRLIALADKFEQLGDSAAAADDIAEAAAHYQAALIADPARTKVAAKMHAIEDRIRAEQTAPTAP